MWYFFYGVHIRGHKSVKYLCYLALGTVKIITFSKSAGGKNHQWGVIMKRCLILISVVCFIVSWRNASAQSMAAAMGENISVVPSGAADVSRNPALLSFVLRPIEITFGFTNLIYGVYDIVPSADVDMPAFTIDGGSYEVFNPQKISLNGGGAVAIKSGKSALGFAFGVPYKSEETTYDLSFSISTLSATSLLHNEATEDEIGTALVAAYSYQVNSRFSVGVQYKMEYKKNIKESSSNNYINGTIDTQEYEKKFDKTYTSSGVIGALINLEVLQIGLMLTTAEYAYIQHANENKKDDYSAPFNEAYDISGSVSGQWIFSSGYGIVVGIAYNPMRNIVISGEVGFRISGSYDETILVEANNIYEETTQTIEYEPLMLISLGIKYIVDYGLSIACGGYARLFSQNQTYQSSNESNQMEIEYSLFGFKLGIEKRISPQSSIVLIGAVERTSINIEASIHETSGLSMTFGVKEVETSFQGSIAVRFFY